jgi:hypothetical protein
MRQSTAVERNEISVCNCSDQEEVCLLISPRNIWRVYLNDQKLIEFCAPSFGCNHQTRRLLLSEGHCRVLSARCTSSLGHETFHSANTSVAS